MSAGFRPRQDLGGAAAVSATCLQLLYPRHQLSFRRFLAKTPNIMHLPFCLTKKRQRRPVCIAKRDAAIDAFDAFGAFGGGRPAFGGRRSRRSAFDVRRSVGEAADADE